LFSALSPTQSHPSEDVAPFFAIGLGYITIETLFDAMEHEHLLDTSAFWQELQSAIAATGEQRRELLRTVANRLLTAREQLYPVAINLLALAFLDRVPPRISRSDAPLNLVAAAEELERLPAERLNEIRGLVAKSAVEICGGIMRNREDAILPIESQLWNVCR